jgi:hypothetical protein
VKGRQGGAAPRPTAAISVYGILYSYFQSTAIGEQTDTAFYSRPTPPNLVIFPPELFMMLPYGDSLWIPALVVGGWVGVCVCVCVCLCV